MSRTVGEKGTQNAKEGVAEGKKKRDRTKKKLDWWLSKGGGDTRKKCSRFLGSEFSL